MADALSRKSYCNNLMVSQCQPLLYKELRKLNLEIVPYGFISTLVVKPTLEDQIKAAQKRARGIRYIKENIASVKAKCFTLDNEGIVYFENMIVVTKNKNLCLNKLTWVNRENNAYGVHLNSKWSLNL